MNRSRTILAILVAILIAGAIVFIRVRSGRQETAASEARAWQIGQDLVSTTNSPRLTSLQPGVRKQLEEFLRCPARVEAVQPGDEPRQADDFKATARLYLINEKNERLGLRLQQEGEPNKFRILGFWTPSTAPTKN